MHFCQLASQFSCSYNYIYMIVLYSMQCWQLSTLCQWYRRLYQMFKWIPSQRTRPVWRSDIF